MCNETPFTRVIERTRYHDKNLQRGITPLKYMWRYGTVVTEHCLIMQYICTKFRENMSKRLCAIERKRIRDEILQKDIIL